FEASLAKFAYVVFLVPSKNASLRAKYKQITRTIINIHERERINRFYTPEFPENRCRRRCGLYGLAAPCIGRKRIYRSERPHQHRLHRNGQTGAWSVAESWQGARNDGGGGMRSGP